MTKNHPRWECLRVWSSWGTGERGRRQREGFASGRKIQGGFLMLLSKMIIYIEWISTQPCKIHSCHLRMFDFNSDNLLVWFFLWILDFIAFFIAGNPLSSSLHLVLINDLSVWTAKKVKNIPSSWSTRFSYPAMELIILTLFRPTRDPPVDPRQTHTRHRLLSVLHSQVSEDKNPIRSHYNRF